MRFSLIVATIGRTTELQRLFESLARQTLRDFEVIVIDQNPDNRLGEMTARFGKQFPINRVITQPGLSRARNLGLAQVTGDIVAFPDDDCWYPPHLLEQVDHFLVASPQWDGIIGHTVDEDGNATLPWKDKAGPLTRPICWRRAVTYVYFLKRQAAQSVGGFDEALGPGAGTPWGAGEDNDYLLRALEVGSRIYFNPIWKVHHPRMFLGWDKTAREKKYRYSLGDGHLLRKHPMPLWWKGLFFGVPCIRMAAAICRCSADQVRFHWATFRGRVQGYRQAL